MKIAITALAAVIALGTSSIACSSPASDKGGEVDEGSALSQLQNPTGSFSDKTAGSAFGNYRAKKADSSKVATPGASGGSGTLPGSIRFLSETSGSQCQQGAACACPGGGTMSYTGSQTADGQLVKVAFDKCVFEDGFGFDGKALLLASNKSLLHIEGAPAAAPSAPSDPSTPPSDSSGLKPAQGASAGGGTNAVAILLAAKGVASQGARKLPLEFALVTEGHYAFLAVKVPDGNIVIGVSDDGNAIVRSKEGTWRCTAGSAGWSCTSDKGQKMNVTEEAPSEGSVTSGEPSAPSAPSDGTQAPAPSSSDSDAGSADPGAPPNG